VSLIRDLIVAKLLLKLKSLQSIIAKYYPCDYCKQPLGPKHLFCNSSDELFDEIAICWSCVENLSNNEFNESIEIIECPVNNK
jgi:uncharacterized CHY-type Zn-finger protein